MKQIQKGFTLIELIVVIVILGILAATALPKFSDLSNDARWASAQAAMGAVQSAANIVYATALVRNVTASATGATVTINGATINLAYGYPDTSAGGIQSAANILAANYQIGAADNATQTFAPLGVSAGNLATGCTVIYTKATGTTTPAVASLSGASTTCN
jgi:MSHA pilin protein MshA